MPDTPSTANGFGILRRPLRVTRYRIADPRWSLAPLGIAVLADLHVGAPWVSLRALERIVAQTNALCPDLILLAGDLLLDRNMRAFSRAASAPDIVARLCRLRAPLGVHAILGNHDWGDCDLARRTGYRRNSVAEAFDAAGIPLLRNRSRAISHDGGTFWLVGTDSQRAIRRTGRPRGYVSYLDADAAFADVPPGAPAIHLAHEPDCFATADPRAFLQISGHTHGGQIRLFGKTLILPSDHGSRYAAGHIREGGHHLIVSRGIGTSGLPLRVSVPPEILLIEVSHEVEEKPNARDRDP